MGQGPAFKSGDFLENADTGHTYVVIQCIPIRDGTYVGTYVCLDTDEIGSFVPLDGGKGHEDAKTKATLNPMCVTPYRMRMLGAYIQRTKHACAEFDRFASIRNDAEYMQRFVAAHSRGTTPIQ